MSHRFEELDANLSAEWHDFEVQWKKQFKKKPTVEAIIFLIGIQEGQLEQSDYAREEKKDVMHIGICSLLAQEGYYAVEKKDKDGWPHFKKIKEFEHLNLEEQELILQKNILKYFQEKWK